MIGESQHGPPEFFQSHGSDLILCLVDQVDSSVYLHIQFDFWKTNVQFVPMVRTPQSLATSINSMPQSRCREKTLNRNLLWGGIELTDAVHMTAACFSTSV